MSPKRRRPPSRVHDSDSAGSGAGGSPTTSRQECDDGNGDGDNHRGFAVASRNLRNVVHHKVGYPLLCYLNRRDWRNVFPEFQGAGEPGGCDGETEVAFEAAGTVLKDAYTCWVKNSQELLAKEKAAAEKAAAEKAAAAEKVAAAVAAAQAATTASTGTEKKESPMTKSPFHEKDLTKVLAENVSHWLKRVGTTWDARSEYKVELETSDGFIDVLVRGDDGSPILMVEAGLLNADWWKKVDQGLKYVKGLEDFNQPLLYVVLTVDRNKDVRTIEKDFENIVGGRIGAFLVTPRSDGGFRMSLLTREETSNLAQLSAHMGRVLRAACLLPKWNATESKYTYLGPSCCHITSEERPQGPSWVLRVYDNRLVHTDRRPDLYLDKILDKEVEKVCEVSDTDNPADALPFGARIEADGGGGGGTNNNNKTIIRSSSRDWLWAMKGQFLAIKVPFRHGLHYAKNIKDFKPILQHLRELHKCGCVHGHIRGFNMVMEDENEGYLIDLDYGGHIEGDNVPRYPEGYSFSLPDGDRPERIERSPISMKDDLEAMASLMFVLYVPDVSSQEFPMEMAVRQLKLQARRDGLKRRISELKGDGGQSTVDLIDELLKFADEAEWNLAPNTHGLRNALQKFGYIVKIGEERDVQGKTGTEDRVLPPRVGTDPATGSPWKQKVV